MLKRPMCICLRMVIRILSGPRLLKRERLPIALGTQGADELETVALNEATTSTSEIETSTCSSARRLQLGPCTSPSGTLIKNFIYGFQFPRAGNCAFFDPAIL